MKKIFIIILLFILFIQISNSQSWYKEHDDKINYVTVGYMTGAIVNCVVYDITYNKHIAFISGIIVPILIGHLKEVYDRNNGGIYDRKDFLCTSLSGYAGSITVRIIIGKRKHPMKDLIKDDWEADNNY